MGKIYIITRLINGIIQIPWWGYVLITILLTHLTILSVTLYLHRCQAHRSIDFHPSLNHFFRFWLWLTTGMITQEWVAVHRKHHACVEKPGDPHSPIVFGIRRVLFTGTELYRDAASDKEILNKYGKATPNDWLELNLYAKHDKLGVSIMLVIDLALFGALGLTIWAIQMLWIPITGAGIINGVGHYTGYRNFETNDNSNNIVPFGIILCGEELHNNHHSFSSSCKFSIRPYEIDLGWIWIKLFRFLHLATIKRTLPTLSINLSNKNKNYANKQILNVLRLNNQIILMKFANYVKQECNNEIKKLNSISFNLPNWKQMYSILMKDKLKFNYTEYLIVEQLSKQSLILNKVFNIRYELAELWQDTTLDQDELITFFTQWCYKVEACEIHGIQKFSTYLRSCTIGINNGVP